MPTSRLSFDTIRTRAEQRKGGPAALQALLPPVTDHAELLKVGDDRYLSEMTRRVFSAGFVWAVIDAKWPGFEEAFLGFDLKRLNFQPTEFWERLTGDTRIVRNASKIMSVRDNALFVSDIAVEYGSFGSLLAQWPSADQVGLLDLLARRGSRLGGNSGQILLRHVGWDGFVLSKDVVACLRDAGLSIAEEPKSKTDLRAIQAQFNVWAAETGLPYSHLSRICSMSIGVNYEAERLVGSDGA